MQFLDKLQKKFKKESRENVLTNNNPPQTTTTFTMKKPFGGLKMAGLAGAFGHCRTDEDKVKLLSVLTNTSYTDDEETASTGSAGDILSSSSSTDERQQRNEEDERTPPPIDGVCPIEITNDCCVVDDVLSHSVNLIANEIDNRPKDDGEERSETIKRNDDYAAAKQHGRQQQEWTFTLYDFDAKGKVTKEDVLSLVRSIYEVLVNAKIPIIRGCHDSSTGRPVGAFKIKLAVVNDATTTNDDNDGDSTPQRENVTNCRGNKKFPFNNNNKKLTTSSHKSKYISPTTDEINDDNDNVDNNDDDDEAVAATLTNYSFDINRFYEEIPLIRRTAAAVKKATKRHHDNGKQSTSPIPYGKLHRHSGGGVDLLEQLVECHPGGVNSSPPGKQCTNCTYRDYVNLSEVENCCSSGDHHHNHNHNNHQTSSSCPSKCIHHIRHCDRHCHCPPTSSFSAAVLQNQQQNYSSSKLLTNNNLLLLSSPPCNDPCLTSIENEYERNLHKKLLTANNQVQHCCKNNKTSLEVGAGMQNHQQHYHHHHHNGTNNLTSLPLNERARAYYNQQKATAFTTKPTHKNRISNNEPILETVVDAKQVLTMQQQQTTNNNSNLKIENLAKLSLHQRKHRNREMDKIRAMQQVREWILNDVVEAGGGELKFLDENNIELFENLSSSPKKLLDNNNANNNNNNCRNDLIDPPSKIEQRGEADGCNKLFVEHKHFHEHHHFHHF